MADETIIQSTTEDEQVNKSNRIALLRFFSVDSDMNMAGIAGNIPTSSTPTYKFYSRGFVLKIAELITGIVCVGLYAKGVNITTESLPFVCFPNVVFGSYIIITSVIILSYAFGQIMPDVLIRAFTSIGMILYFISATISTTIWCSKRVVEPELQLAKNLLLIQAILSFVNCLLYGLDLYRNIKKAVAFEL